MQLSPNTFYAIETLTSQVHKLLANLKLLVNKVTVNRMLAISSEHYYVNLLII